MAIQLGNIVTISESSRFAGRYYVAGQNETHWTLFDLERRVLVRDVPRTEEAHVTVEASTSTSPSFALQHGLVEGQWVHLFLEGPPHPMVVTGEITGVDETQDIVQLRTAEHGMLYIPFQFRGIDPQWNLSRIELRDPPAPPKVVEPPPSSTAEEQEDMLTNAAATDQEEPESISKVAEEEPESTSKAAEEEGEPESTSKAAEEEGEPESISKVAEEEGEPESISKVVTRHASSRRSSNTILHRMARPLECVADWLGPVLDDWFVPLEEDMLRDLAEDVLLQRFDARHLRQILSTRSMPVDRSPTRPLFLVPVCHQGWRLLDVCKDGGDGTTEEVVRWLSSKQVSWNDLEEHYHYALRVLDTVSRSAPEKRMVWDRAVCGTVLLEEARVMRRGRLRAVAHMPVQVDVLESVGVTGWLVPPWAVIDQWRWTSPCATLWERAIAGQHAPVRVQYAHVRSSRDTRRWWISRHAGSAYVHRGPWEEQSLVDALSTTTWLYSWEEVRRWLLPWTGDLDNAPGADRVWAKVEMEMSKHVARWVRDAKRARKALRVSWKLPTHALVSPLMDLLRQHPWTWSRGKQSRTDIASVVVMSDWGYQASQHVGEWHTSSELLARMLSADAGRLYQLFLAWVTYPLHLDVAMDADVPTTVASVEHPCLVKEYRTVASLEADNGVDPLYVDKKYDTTNYGEWARIYPLERRTSLEAIQADLQEKHPVWMPEQARYVATTIWEGRKRVLDGHYALLLRPEQLGRAVYQFYRREGQQWVLDASMTNVPRPAEDVLGCEEELTRKTMWMREMVDAFDSRLVQSNEALKRGLEKDIQHYFVRRGFARRRDRQRLGNLDWLTQHAVSAPLQLLPRLPWMSAHRLRDPRWLLYFAREYLRPPKTVGENPHWYYARTLAAPVLPAFLLEWAMHGSSIVPRLQATSFVWDADTDTWWHAFTGWPVDWLVVHPCTASSSVHENKAEIRMVLSYGDCQQAMQQAWFVEAERHIWGLPIRRVVSHAEWDREVDRWWIRAALLYLSRKHMDEDQLMNAFRVWLSRDAQAVLPFVPALARWIETHVPMVITYCKRRSKVEEKVKGPVMPRSRSSLPDAAWMQAWKQETLLGKFHDKWQWVQVHAPMLRDEVDAMWLHTTWLDLPLPEAAKRTGAVLDGWSERFWYALWIRACQLDDPATNIRWKCSLQGKPSHIQYGEPMEVVMQQLKHQGFEWKRSDTVALVQDIHRHRIVQRESDYFREDEEGQEKPTLEKASHRTLVLRHARAHWSDAQLRALRQLFDLWPDDVNRFRQRQFYKGLCFRWNMQLRQPLRAPRRCQGTEEECMQYIWTFLQEITHPVLQPSAITTTTRNIPSPFSLVEDALRWKEQTFGYNREAQCTSS